MIFRFLTVLFFMALTPQLFARNVQFKTKNLQMYVPDSYKIIEKDENSVNISSADNLAKITLNFISNKNSTAVLAGLGKMLAKVIEDPQPIGEAKAVKINKLSMILFEGSGKYQKKEIQFRGSLVQAGVNDVALLLIIADEKGTNKHMDEFLKILNSIKNIK